MRKLKWLRVSKRNPCAVCGKSDWDTYAYTERGELLSCCMRVESEKPMHNGGWLHKPAVDTPPPPPPRPEPPAPRSPWSAMCAHWQKNTPTERLIDFADHLGVDGIALKILGCCWAPMYSAWAFPMRNGNGVTVGIRLRNMAGDKWAVRGSKQGLFYPLTQLQGPLYIVEGPTDTAAGLTIGLNAVGRPSCRGCVDEVIRLATRLSATGIVVVADADEPGQLGASSLQSALPLSSVVWTPPAKDLREFVRLGGTKEMIDSMTKDMTWRKP